MSGKCTTSQPETGFDSECQWYTISCGGYYKVIL